MARRYGDGARYRFIHDLYGEVLYERVPVSRRIQWHQRIGERLEAGYGAFPRVRELAEQLLHLADRRNDVPLLLGAHEALVCPVFHLGAFDRVLDYTDRALRLYQAQHHQSLVMLYGKDLGISSRYWSAVALWFLGYPDRALARIEEALALAKKLSHPHSLAVALDRAAFLGQFRRDAQVTAQWADAMRRLAAEHGFRRQAALSAILGGWALAMQDQGIEGIAQIRQGLEAYQRFGMAMEGPYFLLMP
jgi:tetratricopeptide (TPR) repeat protein